MTKKIITENDIRKMVREAVEELSNENPLNKTFIAYGFANLDKSKFTNISNNNRMINKPNGGLWAAELNKEGGSDWGYFMNNEFFRISNRLTKHFIFKLKPDAKIFTVDSAEDLLPAPTRRAYPIASPEIDFEKLEKMGYDGIFLTKKGNSELHNVWSTDEVSFNAWDIASICIFNQDVIDVIAEDIYEYDKNAGDYEDYTDSSWGGYDSEDPEHQAVAKERQIDNLYKKYGNLNVNSDMSKFFKGKQLGMMAQGDESDPDTQKAQMFKGTLKTESIDRIVSESIDKVLNESTIHIKKRER